MENIINVTHEFYAWAIPGVFLCVVAFLVFRSATMQAQLKRGFIFLFLVAIISVGYFLLTGKSPTEIPASINSFFNTPRDPEKRKINYYRDPKERVGNQLNEE
ncbi:hypothetical protein UWK_02893 [Desulfocapsa sulfexigens DSM 10523]|uniref:Uncharacterized protein n=1 Tax=Desulfocapsa sulfexigens (strain DSM 10523 / SB164P1) TaxID=1167006 RepID=M1NIN0_DESSD|nr:hypothetical protein UWK_02893 [Desulfocapsa sulfexigens DSM 10523]